MNAIKRERVQKNRHERRDWAMLRSQRPVPFTDGSASVTVTASEAQLYREEEERRNQFQQQYQELERRYQEDILQRREITQQIDDRITLRNPTLSKAALERAEKLYNGDSIVRTPGRWANIPYLAELFAGDGASGWLVDEYATIPEYDPETKQWVHSNIWKLSELPEEDQAKVI